LFLLALPLNVFAQGMATSTATSSGDGIIETWLKTMDIMIADGSTRVTTVWGSGFGEILELTPEQINVLQEPLEAFGPNFTEQIDQPMLRGILLTELPTKLNQVLTPEQQLKYTEISFQASGGLDSWHLNDQLLDVVKLTDAQKEQIRKIRAECEAEIKAARQQRGAALPFDWQNATKEERDKYVAVQVADGVANREADEARLKKYAEQMKAVLTPEQKTKAEKLTAEAPALVAKILKKKQDAPGQGQEQRGKQEQEPRYFYVPRTGSWQPGDPLSEGSVPKEQPRGRFPRGESE
jgi:Spy/CpxP family protein refolding chaperone